MCVFLSLPMITTSDGLPTTSYKKLTHWWCKSCCHWSASRPHLFWPLSAPPLDDVISPSWLDANKQTNWSARHLHLFWLLSVPPIDVVNWPLPSQLYANKQISRLAIIRAQPNAYILHYWHAYPKRVTCISLPASGSVIARLATHSPAAMAGR